MSRPLGLEETLRLVEGLRDALREFAERESRLNAEIEQRAATEAARERAMQTDAEERAATGLREAREAHAAERERHEARFQRRRERIQEARRRVRKATLDAIEAGEGQRKFDLQRTLLKATREREAAIAAADTTLTEFQTALTEEQGHLAVLEHEAEQAFAMYGKRFRHLLEITHEYAHPDTAPPEEQLLVDLRDELSRLARKLHAFRSRLFPKLSALAPLWIVLLLVPLPLAAILQYLGVAGLSYMTAAAVTAGLFVAGVALHYIGRAQVSPDALEIIHSIGCARVLHHVALEKATATHHAERERIEAVHNEIAQRGSDEWNLAVSDANARRQALDPWLEERTSRALARLEKAHRAWMENLERRHAERLRHLESEAARRNSELAREFEERRGRREADAGRLRAELEAEWRATYEPLAQALAEAAATPAASQPGWSDPAWSEWQPPREAPQAVRFGRMEVDAARLSENRPADPRLQPSGPTSFTLPLLLTYPEHGSILLESRARGRPDAMAVLNQIVLRLLALSPPGRVELTLVDPVGLGQTFAGLMHLTDEAEHLIHGRIWTQPAQIEARLADLSDHMEKVIQMYLRNEYRTIAEYNEQAGTIAEKYRILAIADFPAQFSELALQRLMNIVVNGPRCGVYTLIHWDQQQALQAGIVEELRAHCARVSFQGAAIALNGRALPGVTVHLEQPPDPDRATDFIQRVARASVDANRVEVPFRHVVPAEDAIWSLDTTQEIRVPIGRTGATKLQYLAIGRGTRQHVLVAGKTGSGKSTLFHVIITNLSLWCSPDQVEFYLVDFKKGVEFKPYATHRLPHARVVAIESDREYGLSVLQRVDEELRRRGDLFRAAGVQDLPGYRKAGGTERVPRVLLLVDEFQEWFVEEDRIAQSAAVLLDRIVRQGRAFGVHVILGSQTLGGAYTVARSTLGQMVIRIALQCNEADAYLIMDEENAAPRLLSRPGEGIYNDAAGAREGNSPFQTVWLPDDVRETWLRTIRERADRQGGRWPGPMVFEGDAPAEVRENPLFPGLLAETPSEPPHAPRIWLGAPNSIKGPTEVVFERRAGRNLLVVGPREDSAAALLVVSIAALAAQHPPGSLRIAILDGSPQDSPVREALDRLLPGLPHEVHRADPGGADEIVQRLGDEMRAVEGGSGKPVRTFLMVHAIQQFRKLRPDDEFAYASSGSELSAADRLKELVTDGPSHGFHAVVTCDTYGNTLRSLGRKTLAEFGLRVLFQMSANDSASLMDNPAASRLGLHRAAFHMEQEGHIELFRPYALPDRAWVDEVREALELRRGSDG